MLPSPLRVVRAKDPRKTALALERSKAKSALATNTAYKLKPTPQRQSQGGRATKLLGKGGAALKRQAARLKTPGDGTSSAEMVFEGRRASSKDGKPQGMKFGARGKGRTRQKPKNRSSRRAAEWRK